MSEKQTDSGWELLRIWGCFEILLFVNFVIQYAVVRKAEHRNIWAFQICFLGKSRLVNYCLILRECLDSCFDRFLSVSFWNLNVQRCQIPNCPLKWNSKCSKVTEQKVRYLKSIRKILSSPIHTLILVYYEQEYWGKNHLFAFSWQLEMLQWSYTHVVLHKCKIQTYTRKYEIWVNKEEKHPFISSFKNYLLIFKKYSSVCLMRDNKGIILNCCSAATQFRLWSMLIILCPYIYSNIRKCMQTCIALLWGYIYYKQCFSLHRFPNNSHWLLL